MRMNFAFLRAPVVCGLFHFEEGEKLDHFILSMMVTY